MFSAKKMFSSSGDVVVGVHDVAAAQRWSSEKLGRSYSSPDVEEASLGLGYSSDSIVVYLVEISGTARPNKNVGTAPIMFARKLTDVHEHLSSRGVDVGPIQSDTGGNQFFRLRDLAGNELEVCQEH
jgi:hypothetical protein